MSVLQDFQKAIFMIFPSLLLEATVTRSGMLVVLCVLCMLIWPWLDPWSGSHGDDCQPPSRAFIV